MRGRGPPSRRLSVRRDPRWAVSSLWLDYRHPAAHALQLHERPPMPPSFADLGVPAPLCARLAELGIAEPFPVQEATIPDALAGRDVCGKAPTGSGKTLAFGLPLVARVAAARPRPPRALGLAPTREPAAHIHTEHEPLAGARARRACTVYGWVGYEKQKTALRRGVEILVACPGRWRDLMEQNAVRLDAVEVVVVDEADRMADMGFLPEVRKILDATSPDRQTLLFSATLDGDVDVLVRRYQRDPVRHDVAPTERALVDHHLWLVGDAERTERTAELINGSVSTMVFTRTRHGADRLVKRLGQAGVGAVAIHGGRSQGQRDAALDA